MGDDVCDHAAVGVCQHSGVVSRSGAWDSGDDGGRLAVGVGGGDVGDDVCDHAAVGVGDDGCSVVAVIGWGWVGRHDGGRLAVGVRGGDVGDDVSLGAAVGVGDHGGYI